MKRPYFWLGIDAEPRKPRKVKEVQDEVAAYFQIPRRLMTCASRDGARQRQVAMYLAREFTPMSLPNIGRHFGNRDHTTVIHGIRAVIERIETDADLAADIEILRERLAA